MSGGRQMFRKLVACAMKPNPERGGGAADDGGGIRRRQPVPRDEPQHLALLFIEACERFADGAAFGEEVGWVASRRWRG
jgi:hypothetical protein